MIKFIIVTGGKHFSNYVAQSNYWIIDTSLLTVLLIDLFTTVARLLKYKNDFFGLNFVIVPYTLVFLFNIGPRFFLHIMGEI